MTLADRLRALRDEFRLRGQAELTDGYILNYRIKAVFDFCAGELDALLTATQVSEDAEMTLLKQLDELSRCPRCASCASSALDIKRQLIHILADAPAGVTAPEGEPGCCCHTHQFNLTRCLQCPIHGTLPPKDPPDHD